MKASCLQVGVLVAVLSACQPVPSESPRHEPRAQIANPASVLCGEAGGELRIEKLGDGSEFGVCWFEDGRRCEEWALFRGECPRGGRRVTGYATAGARYCVIQGGRYEITQAETSDTPERGLCTLPDGTRCSAQALWDGSCH